MYSFYYVSYILVFPAHVFLISCKVFPIFQNFDPGEKGKLKISGEKMFNEAKSKLHEKKKIYLALNRFHLVFLEKFSHEQAEFSEKIQKILFLPVISVEHSSLHGF